MLPLLETLNDPSLIRAFLRDVLSKDASQKPAKKLLTICKKHGWLTFQAELLSVFESTSNDTLERNIRFLESLSLSRDKNKDRLGLCRRLAEPALSALQQWDARRTTDEWRARKVDRSELLPPLVRSLIALGEFDVLSRLVDHVLSLPKKYDITSVQMPTLLSLQPWLKHHVKQPCAALEHWVGACCERLESRTQKPPKGPANWRRKAGLSCKCADCKELSRFLEDPNEEVHRFKVRKERRRHLHNIIDKHKCDVEHVTDRSGSPQTLVCTKNAASYQRQLAAHQLDLEHLSQIQSMQELFC